MTPDFAVEFIRRAILVTLITAGPLLVVSLLVGVAVSLVQAITQIQEQTLTFIPKILAIGAMFLIMMPWMAAHLIEFVTGAFNGLSTLAP